MAFLDENGLGRLWQHIVNFVRERDGISEELEVKLEGIEEGANNYSLPTATSSTLGGVKSGGDVTIDSNGIITVNDNSHNHSTATTSTAGFMSAADKTKLNYTNIAYGTCSTDAATAAKVITISGNSNWSLQVGSIIVVKFSATNTAQNPTLNVNGTGAKSIWYNTGLVATTSLTMAGQANRPSIYMYDGTNYVWISWAYNPSSTNQSLGNGYGTCSTAAATAAKVVTLSSYNLTTHGTVSVKFTNAVPASATMNINSKGAKPIYYRGAAIKAGVINAGDIATFIYDGTQYHLLAVDSNIDAQSQHKTATVVLSTSAWSSNKQTVTVSGVTADNTVIISPASESQDRYISSSIYCSAQDQNTLTFTCGSVPTAALSINVVILD